MRRYPDNWDFDRRRRPLEDIKEDIEFLEAWHKKLEHEEKLKKEHDRHKKTEFPKFTFLETFSLITVASVVCGPVVGFYYMQFLIKMITQMGALTPLLQQMK